MATNGVVGVALGGDGQRRRHFASFLGTTDSIRQRKL